MKTKELFFVEMTDTFGSDVNYGWVNRFLVSALSARGAMRKVSKETGCSAKLDYSTGDLWRYNVPGACICYFVSSAKFMDMSHYPKVKIL